MKAYQPPGQRSNPPRQHQRRLWCDRFSTSNLSADVIRRQEAIYELYLGEKDLIQDLRMAKQVILSVCLIKQKF